MASIFKQKYTIRNEMGKIIRKQSKYWYIDYKTADGTRKRVKGFKDKAATVQLAAKLEKEAELAEAGVIDRFKEHRKRPLKEHLEDFENALLAKGNTVRHIRQTVTAVGKVFNGCNFVFWSDIQASKTQAYLADLRKDENKISARTFNFYLKAVKQFCNWMVKDQRESESPVGHLSTLNAKTDQRRKRRALEIDRLRRLLECTKAAPFRFGMTGAERAMLYRLAAETGLRAGELKSLNVSSFDLKNCTVTVDAAYSKHRRTDTLLLKPETAKELAAFLSGKMPNVKVFNMPDKNAKMLREDLAEAKIPYKDDSGRYFDFHSLRHTAGTYLAASGVHPKVAQEIMRHSDINLTMSIYTHTLRGQQSQAIEGLPDLSMPSRESAVKTGTDDKSADSAYKKLTKKSDFLSNSLSLSGTETDSTKSPFRGNSCLDNSLQSGQLGTEKEPLSSPDNGSNFNGRCRTRTCDPLIKSQLLCQLS